MYKSFYADNELTALPLFALGLFLVIFLSVVLWVLLKRPQDFDVMAALPLDRSDQPEVKR